MLRGRFGCGVGWIFLFFFCGAQYGTAGIDMARCEDRDSMIILFVLYVSEFAVTNRAWRELMGCMLRTRGLISFWLWCEINFTEPIRHYGFCETIIYKKLLNHLGFVNTTRIFAVTDNAWLQIIAK